MTNGIPKAHLIRWAKLQRPACRTAAQRPDLSLDLRILLLALGHAAPGGHASLAGGGLAAHLDKLDKTTGVVEQYSDRRLRQVISSLVDAGLLAPTSNTRCLVVPLTVLDFGPDYKIKTCQAHKNALSWTGDGWIAIGEIEENLAASVGSIIAKTASERQQFFLAQASDQALGVEGLL